MTEYTHQTSASDRYAAAREALASFDETWDGVPADLIDADALSLASALRALITPPGVHESEERIAGRIQDRVYRDWLANESDPRTPDQMVHEAAREGIRAGTQAAHETWEPEVALRPTQEQMLRWLGIKTGRTSKRDAIFIPNQMIDREED